MNLVPLIELSRGGTPECLHLGAVDANRFYPHWVRVARGLMELGYEIRVIGQAPDRVRGQRVGFV